MAVGSSVGVGLTEATGTGLREAPGVVVERIPGRGMGDGLAVEVGVGALDGVGRGTDDGVVVTVGLDWPEHATRTKAVSATMREIVILSMSVIPCTCLLAPFVHCLDAYAPETFHIMVQWY